MSWNKNTINMSNLDSVLEVLKTHKIPYELRILGYVNGMGLNDDSDKKYPIRALITKKEVIIEQMHRSLDCDSDDYIISQSFKKMPKNWKLEYYGKDSSIEE